jgi:hypothetical protein
MRANSVTRHSAKLLDRTASLRQSRTSSIKGASVTLATSALPPRSDSLRRGAGRHGTQSRSSSVESQTGFKAPGVFLTRPDAVRTVSHNAGVLRDLVGSYAR